MEPLYNEDLATMKIALLYQGKNLEKQSNIKSWDQQKYLVIRGFCYAVEPCLKEVGYHKALS